MLPYIDQFLAHMYTWGKHNFLAFYHLFPHILECLKKSWDNMCIVRLRMSINDAI